MSIGGREERVGRDGREEGRKGEEGGVRENEGKQKYLCHVK